MSRRWRWALLVGFAVLWIVFLVLPSGTEWDTVTVAWHGRPVRNATAVLDRVRREEAEAGTQLPKDCYFLTSGPVLETGCESITQPGVGNRWALRPLTLTASGGEWTVASVGAPLAGDAPPATGTTVVSPGGFHGTVAASGGARVSRTFSVYWLVAGVLWLVGFFGTVVSAVRLVRGRSRRRGPRRRARRTDRVSEGYRRPWDEMRRLTTAPPVTPPSPVLIETPPPAATATNGVAPVSVTPASPPDPQEPGPGPAPTPGWGPAVGVEAATAPVPAAAPASPSPPISPSPVADPPVVEPAVPAPVATDEPAPPAPEPSWSSPTLLVLGPVATVNFAQEPDRQVVTELAAYLVTHPERPVQAGELRAAVWNPTRMRGGEANSGAVGQNLSRLRKALGPGHLPDATGGSGYQLAGTVTSDWARFQGLVEAARRAGDGQQTGDLLRQALALVRGRPFAGVPDRTYAWVWDELLATEIEAAITGAAHWAATHHLTHGPARLAEWSARRGLLAVPGDETLLEDRLTAVAATGDRAALERAWRDTTEAVGDDGPTPTLTRHYQELRTPS